MIDLCNVRVVGFERHYHDIYWEIAPTTQDLQEFEFYVERSEAEAGPFHEISGRLIDRYYMRDNDIPFISSNRTLFYRIKVVHPLTGKEIYSDVVDRQGRLDLVAAEVVRLETMYFKEFAGGMCWLFPRRTFGQRCPQCWDEDLEKNIDSDCPTCFHTGFSGGYHYPIQFFAQIDESPVGSTNEVHDLHEQRMFSFRCPSSPELKKGDLFIDFKNRRMRVAQVHGTTRFGVRVHQEVQATLLQPGSIEDAVPLQVDAETLELTASRNYTNPQNLEAAGKIPDDGLATLLGRYGY